MAKKEPTASQKSWTKSGYKGRFGKDGQPTDDKQAQRILQREGEANQRKIRELNKRGRR
jgi:hypothetical protein